MRQKLFALTPLAWLILAVAPRALPQDARGTILGRVTDPSGALIPSVEVRATSVATGLSTVAKTNSSGNYVLPYLPPATYLVTAELSGFRKFVRDGVQVRVADAVEVNIQLAVGDVAEAIEVKAETPLLSTAEASLGQVVDQRRVMELPLFAGNALDLVHLSPGTVNGTDMRTRKAGFNAAPSQFSTDGAGNNNNEFTIDGISNTFSDGTAPRVAFSPPTSAIAEFRVQTSSFDASVGHTSGSTVNSSTKSGTNSLHGELHWILKHSKLDARTLFENRDNEKVPPYPDNRYGASAGAPVKIPGLYNGKNRTFWFYAWEANKWGSGDTITATVPTEAMRRGDLSQLLAEGPLYAVYDPSTTTKNAAGVISRTAFPNNRIPASRLDPMGQKLMALWPMPNVQARVTGDQRDNYVNSIKAQEDYWVHLARFDHAFNDNHRMFVRVHRDYWNEDKNRDFSNDVLGVVLNRVNRGLAIDDVYALGASFLINVRYGLTQQDFPQRRVSRGFDLASLGFSPTVVNAVDKSLATIPRIRTGGHLDELSTWESAGDGVTSSLTHSFAVNFTRMVGSHNIRFGPEFRVYREFSNRFPYDVSPYLDFDSTFTKGPLSTSAAPKAGGELTALLLGLPYGGSRMDRTASYAEQDKHFSLYVQDDYKITRKLTLNLGLRYELESPLTERFNRAVTGFAFDQPNPVDAQARARYAAGIPIAEIPVDRFRLMGGLTFAAVNGNPRTYWRGEKNNLLPRFGFAYQLRPSTVLRGGYGIFYTSIGILTSNTVQTGFSQSTEIRASLDDGLNWLASSGDPLPNGLIPARGAAGGLATNLGQNVSFYPPERKNPYTQKWSFGFQHQLPAQYLLDVSYVGSRTTRIGIDRELSTTPRQYLSTLPYRDQATINYLTSEKFANPLDGLNPLGGSVRLFNSTITRAGLLDPYPHFGNVTLLKDPVGYAWYHSMQMRVEKRFARGYTFQVSYTWSKAMDATEFLNNSDPMPYECISAIDRLHRLVASGIYELPFGRGRHFGSNWHPVLNFVGGGWQLGGVVQRQSGPPMGFHSNTIFNGNLKDIPLPKGERSVDRWFNTDAGFNKSSAQVRDQALRTFPLRFSGIRWDGQARWDFSAIKNFRAGEKVTVQFRAETFNAWNHPNLRSLSASNNNAINTTFGRLTAQDPARSWQGALTLRF